jgi:hypothetical protein
MHADFEPENKNLLFGRNYRKILNTNRMCRCGRIELAYNRFQWRIP